MDIAKARSVATLPIVSDNPDTYGKEVGYWLDEDKPGKQAKQEKAPSVILATTAGFNVSVIRG